MSQAISKVCNEHVDYEKMSIIAQKYSFQNQAKRIAGKENIYSFLRKGISGDWKNHFNKESCEKFNFYAGKELIKLGYEKNADWIND